MKYVVAPIFVATVVFYAWPIAASSDEIQVGLDLGKISWGENECLFKARLNITGGYTVEERGNFLDVKKSIRPEQNKSTVEMSLENFFLRGAPPTRRTQAPEIEKWLLVRHFYDDAPKNCSGEICKLKISGEVIFKRSCAFEERRIEVGTESFSIKRRTSQ